MINRLLQINLNHARHAQDLLMQIMTERKAGIAVVTEPYKISHDHPCWAADKNGGSAAIVWRKTESPLSCRLIESGRRYVSVKWGDAHVIGVYFPTQDESRLF